MIIGIFLFELVWECNSRYLYTFLPYIILLSSYSINKVYNSIEKKLKRQNILPSI